MSGAEGAIHGVGIQNASARPWPSEKYAWCVVFVLIFAYTISLIDRTLMDLLIVPAQQTHGFSDIQAGWLIGPSFGLFYALMGIPLGRLADSWNRRNLVVCGILLWCLMTLFCGLATTFWQLFIARMGVGIGEACLTPAAMSLIGDYFKADRRVMATSVYVVAGSLGSAIAYLAGGGMLTLIVRQNLADLPLVGAVLPWQAVFILCGTLGFAVILAMLAVREPVRRVEAGASMDKPSWSELSRFLKVHKALFLTHFVGFGFVCLLSYSVLKWGPTFLIRHYGMPIAEVARGLGFAFLLFGTTGCIIGGWFAGRLRSRGHRDSTLRATLLGAAGMFVPAVVAPLMPTAAGALTLISAVVFFVGFNTAVSTAAVIEVTPNRLRAQMTAIYMLVYVVLGYLGPLVTAIVTDHVFGDPSKLGWSLCLTALFSGPIAIALLATSLKHFRAALLAAPQ